MATFSSSVQGSVLHLQFGTADAHNLMDDAWFGDLADCLDEVVRNETVRTLVLSAIGKSFSSGANLAALKSNPWPQGAARSGLARCMERLETFDKPVVAAVHGAAIGGGTTLLIHCDFVYAAPDTTFQLPFTHIGIVPELGSTWLLSQCAGSRLASELLLLGRAFDADTARRAGIVNEIVDRGALMARAAETAQALCALPPASLRASKRLLKRAQRAAFAEAWRAECEALEVAFAGPEVHEACSAFLEKRKPDFSKLK